MQETEACHQHARRIIDRDRDRLGGVKLRACEMAGGSHNCVRQHAIGLHAVRLDDGGMGRRGIGPEQNRIDDLHQSPLLRPSIMSLSLTFWTLPASPRGSSDTTNSSLRLLPISGCACALALSAAASTGPF